MDQTNETVTETVAEEINIEATQESDSTLPEITLEETTEGVSEGVSHETGGGAARAVFATKTLYKGEEIVTPIEVTDAGFHVFTTMSGASYQISRAEADEDISVVTE